MLADRRALQQQVAALCAQHEAHVQALLADKAGMQVAASTCSWSTHAKHTTQLLMLDAIAEPLSVVPAKHAMAVEPLPAHEFAAQCT